MIDKLLRDALACNVLGFVAGADETDHSLRTQPSTLRFIRRAPLRSPAMTPSLTRR